MEWYRNIKRYLRGDDVKYAKDRLVELGYLYASTKNRFGDDSYKATKAFQAANGLPETGVIGIKTWTAMFGDPKPVPSVEVPEWIAQPARTEISQALACASAKRREICLLALQYCVDRNMNPATLRGFYIRGGNLFNKDLTANVMTKAKLDKYFNRSAYEPYYDNGREEMMRKQAEATGYSIVGADCSGMIVGLWRKTRVVNAEFDASANSLYSHYCVSRKISETQAGDLIHRDGHIGLIVCGKANGISKTGWVIEDGGGSYGIQLGKMTDRRLMDFRDRHIQRMGAWKHYGDPKVY